MTPCLHCLQPGKGDRGVATEGWPLLEKLLPEGYAHLVCFYHETAQTQFRAHMKLRITSEVEARKWLEDFQTSSGVTWRKSRTYPNTGRYNAYRVDLRCQHNTCPKIVAKKTKNTSCGATMFLVLKRHMQNEERKSRSKDPHIKDGYLLNINLRHEHNHWLSRDEASRYRDVSSETVAKLKMLFESGHSPSTALHMIKFDLQEQEGENYVYAAADRSVCPDIQFCYRLYQKLFQRPYRSPSGEEMLVDIRDRLNQHNALQGDSCAKMEKTEDGHVAIAICTPVMRRTHTKLKESGEFIYVASFGSSERHNQCLFLLLTYSPAGPLPLGAFITTSKTQSAVTFGLQLLLTLLPSRSFYGREQPQAVMTDECRVLRQSLQAVFPGAKLLLSAFHQRQGMWRWLWSSHSGVAKEDRGHLLEAFQSLIHAGSTSALTTQFNICLADPLAVKYPRFLQQLVKVYGRRGEWAICLHGDLSARGYDLNHFVESAVRLAKEMLLYRLRTYNATQVLDFVTSRMEASFVDRLTDVALSRTAHLFRSKLFLPESDVDGDKIEQVDQNHYVVRSTTSEYDVNMTLGCCTCAVGVAGALCKHQSAVLNKFGPPEIVANVVTPQMRKVYHEIATGLDSSQESINESHSASKSITANEGNIFVDSGGLPNGNIGPGQGPPGEHIEQMIQQFCQSLTDKLRSDPQTFTAPICTFLETSQKLCDSSLASALLCFVSEEGAATLRTSAQWRKSVSLSTTVREKESASQQECHKWPSCITAS
ncbi:uncharacterized protein LOC115407574 isoform X2 [Salarias fasciatus]|uniref:uncharacterized protein LOC115407574 isoform X2 n=1 Tax=Salarias fasciatus TaxID=181472 RepID=UPI00117688DB|nr:uncharacterized protein LOC115407574 isoform X2 [Salarias fasciatus]